MFNMNEYVAFLDEQNAALESVLADMDAEEAMEGLFSKPKSVPKLLSSLNKLISKRCKSAADCDELLEKLSAEEEQFNGALTSMRDAAEELQAGSIDKKEMKRRISVEVKKLKKTCDILHLKDINNKTDSITDEELQNLRDFLVGAKDAINTKKQEFGEVAEEGYGMGHLDDIFDTYDNGIATEAVSAQAALTVGQYALAVLGLAVSLHHSGIVTDARAINHIKKRLKPGLKEAKQRLKQAKKSEQYAECVKALKDMAKINDQLYKFVKKLTPMREGRTVTEYSDGKTKVTKVKKFNAILANASLKYTKEKEWIAKQILLYTEKQKTKATEAAAFIAGFDAAMEAMADDDLDLESDFAALEAQMDDIAFDLELENDLGMESDFGFEFEDVEDDDDLFS